MTERRPGQENVALHKEVKALRQTIENLLEQQKALALAVSDLHRTVQEQQPSLRFKIITGTYGATHFSSLSSLHAPSPTL